jgi:hypothetical protein
MKSIADCGLLIAYGTPGARVVRGFIRNPQSAIRNLAP